MRFCIIFATFFALFSTALAVPARPMLAPRADIEHADSKGHSKEEFFGLGYGGYGLGGLGYGLGYGYGGLGGLGFINPLSLYGLGYGFGYANLGMYSGYGLGGGLWKKDAPVANKVDDTSS